MGAVQTLAAIFALTGVVFLLSAKGGNRLLRVLGIILILQGAFLFALIWLRGS
ncbi:MAG: hypothetical protein SCH98_03025 [Deferrisomatales bacterium]|nr:hypothetical protein [Deferrisomatales bacterium]